ncbi:MAG: ATP-binding protein [Lachnospiraceae bacterium]
MENILRPMLEISVVIPGILLAYFPVRSYLKQSPVKLAGWMLPLLLLISILGGCISLQLNISTSLFLVIAMLIAVLVYTKTIQVSLWKSLSVALSVCGVFSCINSLSRAINAMLIVHHHSTENELWFSLMGGIIYNAICWGAVVIAYYPATHDVRTIIEDENFAQTWYVFWILPLVFIALNLFMIPTYPNTLYTGRVLQGYIVISLVLLVLLVLFYIMFILAANSLNRNAKLQQENHFLSMQQERYDNLRMAIEEVRQAKHDMRHHFRQLSVMAEAGELEKIKEYLFGAENRIPNLDMQFCENRAADSVIGYYYEMAKRQNIPFHARIDLPPQILVDEIDMCLVISNLLENALEASIKTAVPKREIKVEAYMHKNSLLLIQVENSFDGEVRMKDGVFLSTKRKGNGVGIQSVRRISEKNGGANSFTYTKGVFTAKVMIHG